MKRLKKASLLVITLLFVSFFSGCDMYSYITPVNQVSYSNPQWAPPYYPGVRYYYLPDIETYYDLSNQDFIYLDNGQWVYSSNIPSIYAGFDLNNCFAIALDINTYQPWMHNQYYISHYPRYYYRDYYDHSNIPYVRGFNENTRSAVYWRENERNRARNWDDANLKTNHQFRYSKDDREHQNSINYNQDTNRPVDNSGNRQQPNTNYNQNINRPVDNNESRQQQNSNYNLNTNRPVDNNGNREQLNNKVINVTPQRISGMEVGNRQQNTVTPVRISQRANYYGRTIGQPVKVQKQMRNQISTRPNTNVNTRDNGNDRNRNQDDNRR
ncbi:MAG: hypothetical protein P4L34_09015 [Paludibacter sp.]|nr:hypothetical protein [Paludibacter sp.]